MIADTIEQLNQILQAEAARKERPLALLRSAVQALDAGSSPSVDEPGEGVVPRVRRDVTAPADRYVPLPTRTTRGGNFGPAVRAKLRAEALGR